MEHFWALTLLTHFFTCLTLILELFTIDGKLQLGLKIEELPHMFVRTIHKFNYYILSI